MKTFQVSKINLDTYRKEEANDLLHTLKNVHYSLVSKLSDSYIKEYTD